MDLGCLNVSLIIQIKRIRGTLFIMRGGKGGNLFKRRPAHLKIVEALSVHLPSGGRRWARGVVFVLLGFWSCWFSFGYREKFGNCLHAPYKGEQDYKLKGRRGTERDPFAGGGKAHSRSQVLLSL